MNVLSVLITIFLLVFSNVLSARLKQTGWLPDSSATGRPAAGWAANLNGPSGPATLNLSR